MEQPGGRRENHRQNVMDRYGYACFPVGHVLPEMMNDKLLMRVIVPYASPEKGIVAKFVEYGLVASPWLGRLSPAEKRHIVDSIRQSSLEPVVQGDGDDWQESRQFFESTEDMILNAAADLYGKDDPQIRYRLGEGIFVEVTDRNRHVSSWMLMMQKINQ